jgi:hypothetical protein
VVVRLRKGGSVQIVAVRLGQFGVLFLSLLAGCGPGDGASGNRHMASVDVPSGRGGSSGSGSGGAPGGTSGGGGVSVGSGGGAPMAGQGGGAPVGGSGGIAGGMDGGMHLGTGSFDAGTDPNRNAVMPGDICDRLATIQCAGEAACCTNPGRDQATCKKALMGSCTDQAMADQIAGQPAAAFDPAQAKVVFSEIEKLASTCDPTIVAYADSETGIRTIFKGTTAPGASCRPTNPLDMSMAGGALAACKMGDSYACLPSAVEWLCSARAAAGGRCFSDANCKTGLYCNNPNLSITANSSCMTRKADGSACMQANECVSLFCVASKCVPADQQTAYCVK